MSKPSNASIDWEALEVEYRTGKYSNRQLGAKFGVSESAIRYRAKGKGWQKDLSKKVQQQTRIRATQNAVVDKVRKQREAQGADVEAPLTEDEIVDAAAEQSATIITRHQQRIDTYQIIVDDFATRIKEQVEAGKITVIAKNGEPVEIDVPLDYVGKSIGNGVMALERLVKLERQAHGIDSDERSDEGETLEALLAEVAPDDDGS